MTKADKSAPALRYPGFTNDWKKQRLDAVTARIQDGTHFSPPLLDEGQYRYISARNIRNGQMLLHDMQYVDEEHHRDIYKRSDVKFGDVLLTKDGASTGNVCLNELHEEFSLLSSVAFIRADEVNSTNEFIYQYLFSPYGQSEVRSVIAGQAITRITLEKLRAFRFAFPTLPEQQKISAFLGAVDRKIQQLKRKQELLERYKKGVVQQLFSQELRFKREVGGEFPEWEEKPFGDIYTFYNTNSLSRDKLNYDGGDVLNIHYGDIHTKFAAIFKVENERVPYINDDVDLSRVSEDQYCRPCDLVIADASEDLNDIGKTIEIASTDGKRIVAGLHTYLARPKKGSMAPGYGAYLMRSEQVREEIERLAHGTKVMSISRTHLNSIVVSLPSLEEQTRIAGFLMALDAKVAGVAQAVAAAQKWKKGLLQQMFV